jgi:hypothetical protein
VEPGDHAAGAPNGDGEAARGDRLRDVATVDDEDLETTAETDARDVQAPHDPARYTDHDEQPEPHSHREGLRANRPRDQQHELRMVAGLGARGRHRHDDQSRPAAGRDRHTPRPDGDPRPAAGKNPRASPQVEPVPGSEHLDHDRPAAGAGQRDDLPRSAGKCYPSRSGEQ